MSSDTSRPSSERPGPSRAAALRSLPDARLVALCLADHAPAWDALIERYAPLVYTTARRMGLEAADAEDVFQEVSVALCRHLRDLREADRLPGWLATTTRRAAWHLRRRRSGEPARPFSEVSDEAWLFEAGVPVAGAQPDPTPEEAAMEVERRWRVLAGLEKLSPSCRRLLRLLYVREPPASYAEAAVELGIPMNSIGPTRGRCLQRLRDLLEE